MSWARYFEIASAFEW